jgi:hypothetical protein
MQTARIEVSNALVIVGISRSRKSQFFSDSGVPLMRWLGKCEEMNRFNNCCRYAKCGETSLGSASSVAFIPKFRRLVVFLLKHSFILDFLSPTLDESFVSTEGLRVWILAHSSTFSLETNFNFR